MSERRLEYDGKEWVATFGSGTASSEDEHSPEVSSYQVVFRRADGTFEVTGMISTTDVITETELRQALSRALFAD